MGGPATLEEALVTRNRVVAPPQRFISVADTALVEFFKGVFAPADAESTAALALTLGALSGLEFGRVRRGIEEDYAYFGAAAAEAPGVELKPDAEAEECEERFLSEVTAVLDAARFRPLSCAEWDAAQAEEFLLTLPVAVNWSALDTGLLSRHWAAAPEGRAALPPATADRVLLYHRGAHVARMEGLYLMMKVDLLISFLILQPLWAALAWVMKKLRLKSALPEAPPGMDSSEAGTDPGAVAAAAAAKAAVADGGLHKNSTVVERRTFARVFPDAKSVLRQLFKRVRLQEAAFADVVVLYRRAAPAAGVKPGEMDILHDADPAFLQRNIFIKRFRGIPLADLEIVLPEMKIFMPPQVFLQMAITLIGGVVAMVMALRSNVRSLSAAGSAVGLLMTRALQVYTSANVQRVTIERTMQRMLYDRSVAAQAAVLTQLVDEISTQRSRELFITYCILLHAGKTMSAEELDTRCENFLARQFGLKIDFACEQALPTLRAWGLVTGASPGALTAAPLATALGALRAAWDASVDLPGGRKAAAVEGLALPAGAAAVPPFGLSEASPRPTGIRGLFRRISRT